MKAWIWLRAASIVLFIFALGHGLGHLHLASSPPQASAVIGAMKDTHFQIMGSNRTIWDFYSGFSLTAFISALLLAVMVWLLSNMARTQPKTVQPIIVAILIAQIFYTVVCWTNFVLPPAILSTVTTLCLGVAAFAS